MIPYAVIYMWYIWSLCWKPEEEKNVLLQIMCYMMNKLSMKNERQLDE